MSRIENRARSAVAAGTFIALASLTAFACKDYTKELLEPENPGIVDNSAAGSPAAAAALRVGAIGRVKLLANCSSYECLWSQAGIMTDEFKNTDFQNTRQDVDQRTLTTDNGSIPYTSVTQARGFVITAIDAMKKYNPTAMADIAELYMLLGFVEMSLAEDFCNGIPLGSALNGQIVLGKPLTNAEVYAAALAHLDSALAITTGSSDAGVIFIRNAASIIKGRILVNLGQYSAAATAVGGVSSAFQYLWTSDPANNSDDNGIFGNIMLSHRMSAADSFDLVGGAKNVIKNALPFFSANDPRVPIKSGNDVNPKVQAEDGSTPHFVQLIWTRDDPLPVASGIDARLFEAEAQLQANNFAGMLATLNALRATPPKISNYQPTAMAALATVPATKDQAATLFFREKGFWTYGRGQRLGDLRRMIRQYGRTEDNVFPKGVYFKGGLYGSDVNFPVPDAEKVNPLFTGCLDRKA
ncbi:MAG: hypothetical protein CK531_06930 [Gemmatimonadetes bacterium]|nr:MAG: hypothetical protein CK531_06930 [Gemmatimonadota bacterium]